MNISEKPRYEVRFYGDADCEQLLGGEWYDSYTLARKIADDFFATSGVGWAGVLDHKSQFWKYRISR